MGVYSLSKSSINNWTKYPNFAAANPLIIPAAYELISTTVLGSTTSSVTFTLTAGQQATYKHLELRWTSRTDRGNASDRLYLKLNGDTGSNMFTHQLYGQGTTLASSAGFGVPIDVMFIEGGSIGGTATANAFAGGIMSIADAFSTTKNKTIRSLYSATESTGSRVELTSGGWFQTAAVSTITLSAIGSFVSGSRFSIYGLKGA